MARPRAIIVLIDFGDRHKKRSTRQTKIDFYTNKNFLITRLNPVSVHNQIKHKPHSQIINVVKTAFDGNGCCSRT